MGGDGKGREKRDKIKEEKERRRGRRKKVEEGSGERRGGGVGGTRDKKEGGDRETKGERLINAHTNLCVQYVFQSLSW